MGINLNLMGYHGKTWAVKQNNVPNRKNPEISWEKSVDKYGRKMCKK